MFENEIRHIIRKGMVEGSTFAIFRLPGRKELHLAGEGGYDVFVNGFDNPFSQSETISLKSNYGQCTPIPETTPTDVYLNGVTSLRDYHKKHGGKTVLSRVIGGITDLASLETAVESYFDLNQNAFCLFLNSPRYGAWLMATPEMLFEKDQSSYTFMALAGTRSATSDNTVWDNKNKTEQKIVETFISDTLSSMGYKIQIAEPITLRSSNVEHICSTLTFSDTFLKDNSKALASLIDNVAPTPAVCGFPQDVARKNITRYEEHNRDFYAGYTLVCFPDGNITVFVNLRCARIDLQTGQFAIYVGSGITGDSDPEKELEETSLKAAPLLRILQ